MTKTCYIRVDANKTIGTGHLVRTEILADELAKNNFIINFICKDIPKDYSQKLINKSYKIYRLKNNDSELKEISQIINDKNKSILIIDSDKPEFYTKEFQTKIKKQNIKLMIITFYNNHHFYADIVLNQNIMALSQKYSCEPYTKLLLGPKNVILKEDYRKIAQSLDKYKTKLPNKTVLLSFGGIDKPNRTEFVYKALLNCKNKVDKIIIVLGSMYEHKAEIEELAKNDKIKTEIYQNTQKMPYLQAEADIMISSGGLTVWEAGAFKTLNIIMGFSEREQIGGKFIGNNNLGYYLGIKEDFDTNKLSETLEQIIYNNNDSIITKLYENIDVNGIQKVINQIN